MCVEPAMIQQYSLGMFRTSYADIVFFNIVPMCLKPAVPLYYSVIILSLDFFNLLKSAISFHSSLIFFKVGGYAKLLLKKHL